MQKEFTLKSKNKIIVMIGEIEVQTGDALLNWTSINLNSGPDSFYRIHRQAGSQLASATHLIRPYMEVKTGDVFSTIAGLLDFYIVLHGILPFPDESEMYEMLMFNTINVLETYKKKNVCRNLYFTFPDNNRKKVLQGLLNYESKLEEFTFIIMVNEKEYEDTVKLVHSFVNESLFKRLTSFIKK
jgi:hypothetical protein